MNPYKILILRNKLPFELQTDIDKMVAFFSTRLPFPFNITFQEIDIPVSLQVYKTVNGFNPLTGVPSPVDYYGVTEEVRNACRNLTEPNKYDDVIFAWNLDTIPLTNGGVVTSWTDNVALLPTTQFTQLAINLYLKNKGDIWKYISHELMHAFCARIKQQGLAVNDEMDIDHLGRAFYKNDEPTAVDGNFAETLSNLTLYKNLIVAVRTKYLYFKDSESTGTGGHTVVDLKPELMLMLDQARAFSQIAYKITSGYRTPTENTAVGGVNGSEHTLRMGVDILADTSTKRLLIVSGALKAGFTRVGVYLEHIHLGIGKAPAFADNVMWVLDKE